MTALAALISAKSSVTLVEARGPQHQVQKCGMSLSPLISSPHTSIGRAESLYRSVMSTPRYVQGARVSLVEIIVASARSGRSGLKLPPTAGGSACSARLREAYTEL